MECFRLANKRVMYWLELRICIDRPSCRGILCWSKLSHMARSTARPAKRPKLGQNFLADQSAAAKIVAALGDIRSSIVIEIGPGDAVLTSKLAARTGRLIAIELDRVLAAQLSLKFSRQH